MQLPEIGDIITSDRAIELCRHFNLDYLVERIGQASDAYKDWEFDGVSCLPDELAAMILGVDDKTLTHGCALPHDLAYAYGEPGNNEEKKAADIKLREDLISKAKMNKFWAEIFYRAVRIGGVEELGRSFSWAFARRD